MKKNWKIISAIFIVSMVLIYSLTNDKKKDTFANAGKFLTSKQEVQSGDSKPIPQKLQWKIPFTDKD